MKRLKYYLLNMKPTSETYEEMYEGKMYESFLDKDPIVHNHALYWDGEIGYEITKSNRLELSKPTVTIHIPLKNLKLEETNVAALDYIYRAFLPYVRTLNELNDNRKRPARENGHYDIYEPNNKVLARNVATVRSIVQKYYRIVKGDTVEVIDGLRDRGVPKIAPGKNCMIVPIDGEHNVPAYLCVSIMLQVQLPEGKHKKAIQMLTHDLPEAVNCFVEEFGHKGLREALALYEKQQAIRAWLKGSGYCAFVANGSILPREKGGGGPMAGAVPFRAVPEDEVEVAGVRGMAFRKGVTVITGGGYSGKSTLLDALSAGIYNHVQGDGRELVITDETAMKVSAEDGRCVRHVNLSPFIKWIPGGDPADFSTEHASGSTSQAANIMEAIGWGVKLLMIDEDKSATNFMIQDAVMKALIEKEPITPFVERVREVSSRCGVSAILVIGGSSEYLQAADRIYMMKDYRISQVTDAAKALQKRYAQAAEIAERHAGADAEGPQQACRVERNQPRDARACQVEKNQPQDAWACQVERNQPRDTRACQVEKNQPRDTWACQVEKNQPRDARACRVESNQLQDAWACRAEEKELRNLQACQEEEMALEPGDFSFRDEVDANFLSTRPEGSATERLKVSDLGFLILGDQQIDIRMLHDIATLPQLNAIAFLVRKLINQVNPLERFQKLTMDAPEEGGTEPKWICREKEVERLLEEIQEEGLESAYTAFFTECLRWMDLPRKYEILAVLSRMRIG